MTATTAIILAGGFGTRLRSVVAHLPKPMAPVRGKPFLDYILNSLARQGIKKAILSTGHLSAIVSAHYGGNFGGLDLSYSVETEPLGTGGAVKKALLSCNDSPVLVLNGDSLFAIDLADFFSRHEAQKADCSIALRQVENSARYGRIEIDGDNTILSFSEKSAHSEKGLINGGIYLVNREAFLANIPATQAFSIEKDFFAKMVNKLRLKGFLFDDYFIDIGVPADYETAQHEFERFEN